MRDAEIGHAIQKKAGERGRETEYDARSRLDH